MKRPVFAMALAAALAPILLSGCATIPQRATSPRSARESEGRAIDWTALFTDYGTKPDEKKPVDRTKIEALFSANAQECAKNVSAALAGSGTSRETFSGAADAAGYLKATECLPALEMHLGSEQDWFRRFACANAIDSVGSESSKPAVLSALERETDGMVVMALAMYLVTHPAPEATALLERKNGEFARLDGEAAVIACIFLEDALDAAKKTGK